MPPDFTSALGRLLADGDLRARFRLDPAGTAAELGVEELAALDPEGLDRQAETLVAKRLHEVSKLMPATVAALGAEAAPLFRRHATAGWPVGHRRHLTDAVAFGRTLMEEGVDGLCRSEFNRLRFALEGGRWALRFVPDAQAGGRRRAALQILWRAHRGDVRSAAIWLGLA